MKELVKIDKFGKIFIPKGIRESIGAERFEVSLKEGILYLKPVKHPLELYGTLKKLSSAKLKELHEEEHEITA